MAKRTKTKTHKERKQNVIEEMKGDEMSELTRDDLVRWLQSALRANEHDWTNEADRDKESARLQSIFDLALSALTARSEGFREGVEAAARVCENLSFFTDVSVLRGMTKQEMSVLTCKEAAAEIRALSPRETDESSTPPPERP